MADNSSGRKKTVIISLLTFLLIGGSVFLFFIIQGSNDLTKPKNSNMRYDSVIRGSLAPFFRYLGLEEENPPRSVHEARLNKYLEKQSVADADMAAWLSESSGSGAPASGDSGSRSSAPSREPAVIPRMTGGGGGLSSGDGGGSSSSGGGERFAGGPDKGNTKISGAAPGGGLDSGADRRGSLGSLRSARAMLSGGLRSGSAMTAKSSWDKSFGAGGGGRGGSGGVGNMAYEKKALTGLDVIKTGDISDLKASNPVSAPGTPAASMPKLVDDKKGSEEDKGKTLADIGRDMLGNLGNGALGSPGSKGAGGVVQDPPADIKNLAEKDVSEGGYFCKNLCTADEKGNEFVAQDKEVVYKKEGEIWTATYSGEYRTGTKEHNDPYATYEQTFVVTKDSEGKISLEAVDRGTCVLVGKGGGACPKVTPAPGWQGP